MQTAPAPFSGATTVTRRPREGPRSETTPPSPIAPAEGRKGSEPRRYKAEQGAHAGNDPVQQGSRRRREESARRRRSGGPRAFRDKSKRNEVLDVATTPGTQSELRRGGRSRVDTGRALLPDQPRKSRHRRAPIPHPGSSATEAGLTRAHAPSPATGRGRRRHDDDGRGAGRARLTRCSSRRRSVHPSGATVPASWNCQ